MSTRSAYKRFVDNREPNPGIAYQAAKDYMVRYGKKMISTPNT